MANLLRKIRGELEDYILFWFEIGKTVLWLEFLSEFLTETSEPRKTAENLQFQ